MHTSTYAYRIFVDKITRLHVVDGLCEEMDYDNFKSEVGRHQGREESAYVHVLREVGSVSYRIQR